MTKRIKAHFQYGWWVYLLIIAAVITLWLSVFAQLAKPKANEVLNITFVGGVNSETLADDIKSALDGKTQTPLKKVNVEFISGKNVNLAEIIAMRCLGDCDLIIFGEEYIGGLIAPNFRPLDAEKLSGYFGGITPFVEEEKTYGVLLYDGVSRTNFANYYKGDKKFWAFITPVSENAAGLNGKGSEKDDAALKAIRYLTEAV